MFSEPAAGLSGIERVGGQAALGTAPAAPAGAAGYGRGVSNGRAHGGGPYGERADRHNDGRVRPIARRTTEVTERTLLKGILYAFQVQRVV